MNMKRRASLLLGVGVDERFYFNREKLGANQFSNFCFESLEIVVG